MLHRIDARSPWQNGKTERHGGIYKDIIEKAIETSAPVNDIQLDILEAECHSARSRYSGRAGYSPMERVFGFSHRLPGDITTDDSIDPFIRAAAAALLKLDASRRARFSGRRVFTRPNRARARPVGRHPS